MSEDQDTLSAPEGEQAFHADAAAVVADLIRKAKASNSATPAVFPPTKISASQQRIVQSCVTASGSGLLVRRIVVAAGEASAFDAIALGALHRAAVLKSREDAAADDAKSLLVVVENDDAADRLALRLRVVFGITSLVVDGGRFPTMPALSSTEDLRTSVVVVISTAASLCAVDRRSAVWKFCGALVLCCLTLRGADASALKEARRNIPARSCIVIGCSSSDVHDAALQPLVVPVASDEADAPAATRSPTQATYMVVEGSQKFMALYQLVLSQSTKGSGRPLVVHFACAETCAFVCDALYALQMLPDHVRLVCDSEILPRNQSDKSVSATVRLAHDVLKQFQSTVDKGREGVVLLSSLRLVPPVDGAVFVQFDPILDVMNFSSFLADRVLTQATTTEAAPVLTESVKTPSKTQSKRARSNSPPPARAIMPSASSGSAAAAAAAQPGGGLVYQYHAVILFVLRNELDELRTILTASGARFAITYTSSPAPAAGNSSLLAAQKLKSLVKKMFVLNNKAYEAYRGLMQVYARLTPKIVYNVKEVNLQAAAEVFGLSEAPLLDLRTKTTVFRPKEDLYKTSMQRLRHERKTKKAFADKELIGEEPEDHMAEA